MIKTGRRLVGAALLAASTVSGASAAEPDETARYCTLEDMYGPTGETFQGGIGFINRQGDFTPAVPSYGLAVDDVQVVWSETTLVPDASVCATGGSCASIAVDQNNVYEANTLLVVTVLDASPYGPAGVNDCNQDGDFVDAGLDDTDCNDNGTADVVVVASSQAELTGEIVVADATGNPGEYRGEITTSATLDGPGVLFVAQQGAEPSTASFLYFDEDDGTGSICKKDVNPQGWGRVETSTELFFSTCTVQVIESAMQDNGDGDFFADTNETVMLTLTFENTCGIQLTDCTARISTNSPEIDCVIDPVVDLGDIAEDGIVVAPQSFVFRVADVNRGNVLDDFSATFNVTMSCTQFDALALPQSLILPLDIDIDDMGQTPIVWLEDFESGTLGKFEVQDMDIGIPPDFGAGEGNFDAQARADGMRCQYSDPFNPNAGSAPPDSPAGELCWPGKTVTQAALNFWQAEGSTTGAFDGGRAYSGTHSLYFGLETPTFPAHTTPIGGLEAVRTTQPVNLGILNPQLRFKHMVSFMRAPEQGGSIGAPSGKSADRGVVGLQLADEDGFEVGDWIKLEPYQNGYRMQGYEWYSSCHFDPIDDGNDEDDFFDPEDPARRTGPSSTCFPEFSWSGAGDTQNPYSPNNTGTIQNPGAGLEGSHGPAGAEGTWIESAFDLSPWRGRRVRLRWLVSSFNSAAGPNWETAFAFTSDDASDDGWWIDRIEVDETLQSPAEFLVDPKPNTGLAPCGATCTSVVADCATDPDPATMLAPGQAVELDASGSVAPQGCLSGTLQYRFSHALGDVLRGWTDNPVLPVAPANSQDYVVDVRCSTDTACSDSALCPVDVDCPSSGTFALGTPFPETITANADKQTFGWTTPRGHQVFAGPLALVGGYVGTVLTSGSGDGFVDPVVPFASEGRYYVVREGIFCNAAGLWTTAGPGEQPGRDTGGLP